MARASILIVSADAHFTTEMPTKRLAADCLLTDEAGRLLVLDPPYKVRWDIPGGIVEVDESPRRAAQREAHEEIGLDIEPGELLVVDWKPRDCDFTEVVALLFDGGTLTARDIDRILVEPSEVRGYRFVELDEAATLLDAELFERVAAGLAARATGRIAYLENGVASTSHTKLNPFDDRPARTSSSRSEPALTRMRRLVTPPVWAGRQGSSPG